MSKTTARTLSPRVLAIAFASMIAAATPVSAASIVFNGQTGAFNYSYTLDLIVTPMGQAEAIEAGDYFTIYDFAGFVPASNTQPANWSLSTALVGQTPPGATVVDSPAILNLTWTYAGTPILLVDQGPFVAGSIFGPTTTDSYAVLVSKRVGNVDLVSFGTTTVPLAPEVSPVPEPTSMLLLGGGLVGIAAAARRRRRGDK